MATQLNPVLRYGAVFFLVGLIVLCPVWELGIAPLRPGGSLLALKVIPLLFPLRGVIRGNLYTLQWSAMLILLYLMEGLVRAYSDPSGASVTMAKVEIILSLGFYLCAIFYVHPAKKAARAKKRAMEKSQ
jgi:uncharacterized membrane protein